MSKQIFEDAVERELLARNPFAGLHGAVGGNRERDFFVDRDTTAKVLDACPDSQWRLLFALARYGGLRCPSEILALTWSDVNWGEGRMIEAQKPSITKARRCASFPCSANYGRF